VGKKKGFSNRSKTRRRDANQSLKRPGGVALKHGGGNHMRDGENQSALTASLP